MKNDYEKYIKEVWDMKEKVYKDYLKSGFKNYTDFLKSETEKISSHYHLKTAFRKTAK